MKVVSLAQLSWSGICQNQLEVSSFENIFVPANSGATSSGFGSMYFSRLTASLSLSFFNSHLPITLHNRNHRRTPVSWLSDLLNNHLVFLHPFQFLFDFRHRWKRNSPGRINTIWLGSSSSVIFTGSQFSRPMSPNVSDNNNNNNNNLFNVDKRGEWFPNLSNQRLMLQTLDLKSSYK